MGQPPCRTVFVELEYFDHNPQKFSNWLNSFQENWFCVFHSTFFTPPGKWSKILEKKYKLVLSPAHWIDGPLVFCDFLYPFARSIGPTFQKKEKKRKLGGTACQNKMADICYRKPTIIKGRQWVRVLFLHVCVCVCVSVCARAYIYVCVWGVHACLCVCEGVCMYSKLFWASMHVMSVLSDYKW